MSRSERDMRFEDVIGRFLREPDRPLTAASVLEAAGIVDVDPVDFARSPNWLGILEPAIISGRKNGAVAPPPPARMDVIYGYGIVADSGPIEQAYDRAPWRTTPGSKRRKPQTSTAVPVLAGPRAYFND